MRTDGPQAVAVNGASKDTEVAMRIDLYTKAVLTVIAACLLWIAVGGPSLLPGVQAQGNSIQSVRVVEWEANSTANVRIVGWRSGDGGSGRNLPLPVITKPD